MAALTPQRAAAAGQDWRDPHSISNQIDTKTTEAIITRLESRGKDPIFRSLFDTYFPCLISRCSDVLEIGAGTGVVARALVASGYNRRVCGVDQNPAFLDAAKQLATAEGISSDVLTFGVADARTLRADVQRNNFDGVIMHTLISHVDEPIQVLQAAREVVAPGALLVIIDGDYRGLAYHSPTKLDLSESVSRALVTATFASPTVVRDLPALLTRSGWALESASGKTVSEIGHQFSYWKSFAEAYMPRVVGRGLLSQEQVDEWWMEQKQLAQDGHFFASCTYYTLIAKAV